MGSTPSIGTIQKIVKPMTIRMWPGAFFLPFIIFICLSVEGAPFQNPPIDAGAHWAFQPIERPAPPHLTHAHLRIINPIDQFILAKLEAYGISFSPPASKVTLIRRVTLDLIGLPPTPEEIDAFVNDPGNDLPLGNFERDPAQRLDRAVARLDFLELEQRAQRSSSSGAPR